MQSNPSKNVLIVYHSRLGSVEKMARLIARGVESVEHCHAVLRTVSENPTNTNESNDTQPQSDPEINTNELEQCDALILGSPTRFGNMSAQMKYFIDSTSAQWMSGKLVGKPAGVFTSSSSMHGGQEATLLSMMIPLLHHGMLICGLPYTEKSLTTTTTGGTPYGASHVAGSHNNLVISKEEKNLCIALGKRIALLTKR